MQAPLEGKLVALALLNYAAAVGFVAGSKIVLLQVPSFPCTVAFAASASAYWCSSLWVRSSGQLSASISRKQWKLVAASSLASQMGFACAILACSVMSASLVETIKASTPIPGVILAGLIGDGWPSRRVQGALALVVSGVMMASFADASARFLGVICALLMTWGFAISDNFVRYSYSLPDRLNPSENLYRLLQFSTVFAAPPALLEVRAATAASRSELSTGLTAYTVASVLFAGCCWFLQNQSTSVLLEMVPISVFSIIASLRRAVVIVALLLIFRTELTPLNAAGLSFVLVGFVHFLRQDEPEAPPPCSKAVSYDDDMDIDRLSSTTTFVPSDILASSKGSEDNNWLDLLDAADV